MLHLRWPARVAFAVLISLVGLSLTACTTPNPLDCSDGTCTDPTHPFCDVDGSLGGGTAMSCIAVACMPGTFGACRGDDSLVCNAAGTSYDLTRCADGCEPTAGCRLCEANQTVCVNNTLQTCDANGAITTSQTCTLGCFDDQPRCRDIDPSNYLASFASSVTNAPDLVLTAAVFDTGTGVVSVNGQPVAIPTTVIAGSGDGAAIRVFIVGSLELAGATINPDDTARDVLPALAIVANRALTVTGDVVVSPRTGSAVLGCRPGNGGFEESAVAGGGGGGNATRGGDGGTISNTEDTEGGLGDPASGTDRLVPLRGGCSGGQPMTFTPARNGGGAIQLTSKTSIYVDATIDARGKAGATVDSRVVTPAGGGGAGGSILLEAPSVELSARARLLASGGSGYLGCSTALCGAAGRGGTATSPATAGETLAWAVGASGGGGGGGAGRIRINTSNQIYAKAASTIEDAITTTGILATR